MHNSAQATKLPVSKSAIAASLASKGVDVLIAIEDDYALVQACVDFDTAVRMMTPVGANDAGMFRYLSGGMVEIDASVMADVGWKMVEARWPGPNGKASSGAPKGSPRGLRIGPRASPVLPRAK